MSDVLRTLELARDLEAERAENARLRRTLASIAEYCSGEDQTLGAIKRLVSIRNTAEQALREHQQDTHK